MPSSTSQQPWWRSAVIYQVYIRSFADDNGDGIGDIGGIRSRLPYLRELGVDALWITPWYPSPMADGGYDVADFRDIAPEFGSLVEAEKLIQDAHAHELRIILDIVPNHTSDQHRWFRAALEADPGSPERDRYLFRRGSGPDGALPPNDWRSVFGGPAWTRVGGSDQWYLHLFAPEQPDLNWENVEVRQEFEETLRFWFDLGVDGFRIDVAHGLVKHPELPDIGLTEEDLLDEPDLPDHPHWDREGVHDVYRHWRAIADSYQDQRVFVAEAWVDQAANRLARYLRGDELHTAFNFDFLRCAWDAIQLRRTIDHSIASLTDVDAPTTWVLSNHDVTRHVTRYGRPTGSAGQRRDGTPPPADLVLGHRRARAAALLMLALPGGAYIYQGEELGLPEVEDLPDEALQDPIWERSGHQVRGRDGCRVPLPWTTHAPALGFGTAAPWLPQPADWQRLSVQVQQADPDSMLELYRAALGIRASQPELGDGPLRWQSAPTAEVLEFDREYDGNRITCMVNFGSGPVALPSDATVLLASWPMQDHQLPSDAAAWLRH